jgi:hypothetical protein
MSVKSTPKSAVTGGSARLAAAIAVSAPTIAAERAAATQPDAARTAARSHASQATQDAGRGAHAAPDHASTGADAAETAAQSLGGTGGYTPAQASSDSYGAQQSPVPGVDAGSVASADGPTAADVAPSGQPGFVSPSPTGSAWTPEWKQKFVGVMRDMGMDQKSIDQQLQGMDTAPSSDAQLGDLYGQMRGALGDFDSTWRSKFTSLLTELKTPAKDQEQALAQLSGSGLTTAQLQDTYDKMVASKPAWNDEYASKFKSLDLPDSLMKQLEDSGAPKEALDKQFASLVDTKMSYQKDGRLDKLLDAKATPDEKWGVMLNGVKGDEFDKAVEQIHSHHVSGWKRVLSFGVNLIPGVYALQFVTGKDWVTGDKIDRTNPLNIVGAVASGFAGFTAVRGAIQGVQGLSAANSAWQAGKATTGLTQAVEAANLTTKFDSGLHALDFIKSAVPVVNRFGEAGRLASVGRGYYQGMQLAAGAAAMTSVSGGGAVVDATTKANVLDVLKQGGSIEDALATTGRSSNAVFSAGDVAKGFNDVGFLQGGVGRAITGNGNFRFNPFRTTATISSTGNPAVMSLGRGVNFASKGGLAQGIGAVQGSRLASDASLAEAALHSSNPLLAQGYAAKVAGVNGITDDAQRIMTLQRTGYWADKLGVADASKLRSFLQLGGGSSDRAASRISSMVEKGGSAGYRAGVYARNMAQGYGAMAAAPFAFTAVAGVGGQQVAPMWDYLKHRNEITAAESKARTQADKEQQDLERLYEQQHAGDGAGGGASAGAGTGAGPADAAARPQVVGTAPSGGQLVFDPQLGGVYDTVSGDVYDPSSGQRVGNLSQLQQPQAQAQPGATNGAAGAGQVYVDQATGRYVDPTTGLSADPATGQVYDSSGRVVSNLNAQPAA